MSNDNGESIDIQLNVPATKQGGQPTQSQKDENPRTLPQNPACPSPLTLPQQLPASETQDSFAEISMNKALYDPPRWGWTALGGIADVLSPHEVREFGFIERVYPFSSLLLSVLPVPFPFNF